jgi:hypothetical protein
MILSLNSEMLKESQLAQALHFSKIPKMLELNRFSEVKNL